MNWQGIGPWEIVREEKIGWKHDEDGALSIFGKTGSIWGTREFRLEHFHVDEPPVVNIFLANDGDNSVRGFSLDVKCFPKIHGGQAGIVYYVDDLNYVKLVLEGNKSGGTMIILAVQADGEAEVSHKVGAYENDGASFHPLQLRFLPVSDLEVGLAIHISGNGFNEVIHSDKVVRNGRFGFMAHSLEASIESEHRWASFRNPSLLS